ncbi:MAG: site-specific DNA-methyltransferase [Spirochaetales bacterium]|nr:site-specific DNA-methyltransferase [Spirochaetales bacterium]
MKLESRLYFKNALEMTEVEDESVDLVVTSPPYPMIQMWDEIFTGIDESIGTAIDNRDGGQAWELMNAQLDLVWAECLRALKPGGFACINIGDATRKIGDQFRLYPNHSRIISAFVALGFDCLPSVIWRKPTNAPNKFMGSGMLPSGAYVTLEHEYILIFRKGARRTLFSTEEKLVRQKSTFFWEERNVWFSDIWQFKGATQPINDRGGKAGRDRSGAYPYELVHRLINMYSIQKDTVLDPFHGTGTTLSACIVNGRKCIGYEIDGGLAELIYSNAQTAFSRSGELTSQRLERHRVFVADYRERKTEPKYTNEHYGFPVITRQERNIRFPAAQKLTAGDGNIIICDYL